MSDDFCAFDDHEWLYDNIMGDQWCRECPARRKVKVVPLTHLSHKTYCQICGEKVQTLKTWDGIKATQPLLRDALAMLHLCFHIQENNSNTTCLTCKSEWPNHTKDCERANLIARLESAIGPEPEVKK